MHIANLRVSAVFSFILALTSVKPSEIRARQDCANNFSRCSPPGAASISVPQPGSGLSSLYVDLLDSISGVKRKRDDILIGNILKTRASAADVCCAVGTDCLLLQNLNLPFCYDKFTTNFFLPDNSYGTIVTGSYTPSDGGNVNLLSGSYTLANGTSGNVYGPDSAAKPNTATLTLPTQYTASGVGSAIPASALGAEITYTTTIPGTTIPPTTIPVEIVTITPTAAVESSTATLVATVTTEATTTETVTPTAPAVVVGSTAPTPTVITQAATTVPGTTIPPTTLTVTTAGPVTAKSPTPTGAATAMMGGSDSNSMVGLLSFLFAALLVL